MQSGFMAADDEVWVDSAQVEVVKNYAPPIHMGCCSGRLPAPGKRVILKLFTVFTKVVHLTEAERSRAANCKATDTGPSRARAARSKPRDFGRVCKRAGGIQCSWVAPLE